MANDRIYSADRSLYGKLRRRASKLVHRRPARLPHLARPLLTFSFDDAPQSAAVAGASIIERYGWRATFFISSGIMGEDSHFGHYTTADQIRALHARGHEIACHTFTHIDCGQASARAIEASLEHNQNRLVGLSLPRSETFAYPYGDVSPQAKALLSSRYLAARALHHGLIVTGTDLNQTPAVGIEGRGGEAAALDWMRRTKAHPQSWLVLYTHDVREDPSPWGCTPQTLKTLAEAAKTLDFEVVTYGEGARRATGLGSE